ncbi:MAG: F510_1955 family glycosylhydrolase [Acidimicrobiia bacterium]
MLAAAAAGLAIVVALLFSTRSEPNAIPDAGQSLAHIHGLGVNPADNELYAATHFGLFRVPPRGAPQRVSAAVQDTMGFTVVGADHFLASGHPDIRDQRLRGPGSPPLLGLIESTDAGRSWAPLSLLGAADFHSLAVAHGNVYGYDSTGSRFMVSPDRQQWETRSTLVLGAFAVDPGDAEHVVASAEGGLLHSRDGGRNWQFVEGPSLVVLSWGPQLGLWGVSAEGETYRYVEDGWELRRRLPGEPQALLVTEAELFAATTGPDGVAIHVSADAAESWRLRYSEP